MIAEGGYGCIFHPSIPCKSTEEPDEEFVSKIVKYDFNAKNEIEIGKEIEKIKSWSSYFNVITQDCEPVHISQIKWERPDQHFWYGYVIAFCYSDPNNSHWYLAKTEEEPGWGSGDSCYTPSGSVTPWNGEPCIGGNGLENCISACETAGINCNSK